MMPTRSSSPADIPQAANCPAPGRVVLFLNADDELTDADLRPCVQPIIEGRCTAVAAHVYWHCRELRDWQRDWQRTIPRQLEGLQRICRELSAMGVGIFHRPALR